MAIKTNLLNKSALKVNITQAVTEQINTLALSDTKRELGGVLLGTIDEKKGPWVKVEAAVEAKYTDAAQTSVTFTHSSWEYMNKERETRYPHLKIVGWFHTHPGFGIFLSADDIFIHKNFFDLPWQVAYVVDPVNETAGLFGWGQGSVKPIPYEVDGEKHEAVVIKKELPHSLGQRFMTYAAIFLLICAAGMSGYAYKAYKGDVPHSIPIPLPGQEMPGDPYSLLESLKTVIADFMDQLNQYLDDLAGGSNEQDQTKDKKSLDREGNTKPSK
ncbi:MAG: Mov34/MPN/PAD-1 family protein [Candidatus Saccharibacteria bacterium]